MKRVFPPNPLDYKGASRGEYRRVRKEYEATRDASRDVSTLSTFALGALLDARDVSSRGGRAIQEWRLKNVAVRRDFKPKNYPTPVTFLRLESVCGDRGTFQSILLDIIYCVLLPYLSTQDVFSLMYTCRRFQAACQRTLVDRANLHFGPGGTPMALSLLPLSKRELAFRFGVAYGKNMILRIIEKYGCVENVYIMKEIRAHNERAQLIEDNYIYRQRESRLSLVNKMISDAGYTFSFGLDFELTTRAYDSFLIDFSMPYLQVRTKISQFVGMSKMSKSLKDETALNSLRNYMLEAFNPAFVNAVPYVNIYISAVFLSSTRPFYSETPLKISPERWDKMLREVVSNQRPDMAVIWKIENDCAVDVRVCNHDLPRNNPKFISAFPQPQRDLVIHFRGVG